MRFSIFLFVLLCSSCGSEPEKRGDVLDANEKLELPDSVFLACTTETDDMAMPRSVLYLQTRETKIMVDSLLNCNQLTPDQYESYDIPSTAQQAVYGYWAGYGEYYYLKRTADALEIYYREMGEEDLAAEDYKLLRTFKAEDFISE